MPLAKNIAANLAGKVWIAATNFFAVPFLIRLLGMQSYGLITFFTTLMAIVSVLDLGIGTAVNRQLARDGAAHPASRDLLRALEIIYWVVATTLGLGLFCLASWLAADWLAVEKESIKAVTEAIRIMAAVLFFRWPVALYSAALLGLQKQVLQNIIAAIAATVQNLGGVTILLVFDSSLRTYFVWQAIVALIWLFIMHRVLWKSLAIRSNKRIISLRALSEIWRFAFGMFFITITSIVLTQSDKVILSKILSLTDFGYYGLASSISNVITVIPTAIYTAAFPSLSRIISTRQHESLLAEQYHKLCQALSVLVIPPALALIFFSKELLLFYTGDANLAQQAYVLVSLLTLGNLFLAMMVMPLALQLACGWTKLSLYKNVLAICIFIPTLLLATSLYQGIGAALTWIFLTSAYFLIEVPIMHRRLLVGEVYRWYVNDIAFPFAAALAVIGTGRYLLLSDWQMTNQTAIIIAFTIVAFIASAATLPRVLSVINSYIARQ